MIKIGKFVHQPKNNMAEHIISEITPLSGKDCFYIVDRHKSVFSYPLHRHAEYELNFIQNGKGLVRIVGDSVEKITNTELVLIGEKNLEHTWEQGECKNTDIREITIQFSSELLSEDLLSKNQFASIRHMLSKAKHGISFPLDAIMKVYHILDRLATEPNSFMQFIQIITLLYELSQYEGKLLSSTSFLPVTKDEESRRVNKVKQYILEHYTEDITLSELSELVGMGNSSFSRFFKERTGTTMSNYLIDVRLGHAARALVDSTKNVSEICFECGFNNLSNFNRIFKQKRGLTPRDFRQLYKKRKMLV